MSCMLSSAALARKRAAKADAAAATALAQAGTKVFVDVATGCRDPCAFRCVASGRPVTTNPNALIGAAVYARLWSGINADAPVRFILHGAGDAGEFPWEGIGGWDLDLTPVMQSAEITIRPSIPFRRLAALAEYGDRMCPRFRGLRVWAKVSTPEEVRQVHELELRVTASQPAIPGAGRWRVFGYTIPAVHGAPIVDIVRAVGDAEYVLQSDGVAPGMTATEMAAAVLSRRPAEARSCAGIAVVDGRVDWARRKLDGAGDSQVAGASFAARLCYGANAPTQTVVANPTDSAKWTSTPTLIELHRMAAQVSRACTRPRPLRWSSEEQHE